MFLSVQTLQQPRPVMRFRISTCPGGCVSLLRYPAAAAIGSRSRSLAAYFVLKRRDVRASRHDFHHRARTVFQLILIYVVAIPNWNSKIPSLILSFHPPTAFGATH